MTHNSALHDGYKSSADAMGDISLSTACGVILYAAAMRFDHERSWVRGGQLGRSCLSNADGYTVSMIGCGADGGDAYLGAHTSGPMPG